MGKFKKEPIEFKKERSFSQLLESPFKFFTQEFKPLIKIFARYAGPWVAVALLAVTILSSNIYQSFLSGGQVEDTSLTYIAIISFFLSLGFLAVVVATQSYIALYVRKGKGNFSADDVGELIKKNVVKIFLAGLLVFIMVFIGFVFLYLPGIYLAIALGFFAVVIVFEDASVGQSISRSFKVIKGNWWFTFGLTLVFGMMVGTIMYIFIIPIYVVIFSSAIAGTTMGLGSVIVIVFSIILYFIAYVLYMAMLQMLYSFQYFNLVSKNEGLTLYERINAINKPKTEPNETPEENKSEKNTSLIKEEETNKTEDTFYEEKGEEKNRFENDDDFNRFKPKY